MRRVATCPAWRARMAARNSRTQGVRRTIRSASAGSKPRKPTATSWRVTRQRPRRASGLLRALHQLEPVTSTSGSSAAISTAISRRRAGSGSTTMMPRSKDLSAQRLINRLNSAAERPVHRWTRRNSANSVSRLKLPTSRLHELPDATHGRTKTPLRRLRRTRPSLARSA